MSAAMLAHGLILSLAISAGLEPAGHGDKRALCCPFHEDRQPSAFIDLRRNVFFCSVCTPDRGWTTKQFAQALGLQWPPDGLRGSSPSPPRRNLRWPKRQALHARPDPEFGPAEARRAWDTFQACARDGNRVDIDELAYRYLTSRGLMDAWEESAFGIVPSDPSLPGDTSSWRQRGYAIAVPLYDATGTIGNVQARAIVPMDKRQLVPRGSRTAGLTFANAQGLALLTGTWRGPRVMLLGEGLTDALAYSFTAPMPALSSPGTSVADRCLAEWVKGFTVLLALDTDDAGRAATASAARRAFELGAARVRQVTWPGGATDACDVLARFGADELHAFLASLMEGLGRG